jgi:hypothetical protein
MSPGILIMIKPLVQVVTVGRPAIREERGVNLLVRTYYNGILTLTIVLCTCI